MRIDYRFLPSLFAWAVLSCAASPPVVAPAEARAVSDAQAARLIDRARRAGAVRVIVEMAAADPGQTVAEAAKEALIRRLRGVGLLQSKSIPGTPYLVLELTAGGMERLARDPAVARIREDNPVSPQ